MYSDIPGKDIPCFGRKFEIDRFVVLDLGFGDDQIQSIAARDEVLVDVERGEIL